jgi:MGT family glycosyltransferase
MKKKIIFFSTPAVGHMTPAYGVIKKLIKEGYIVDWYSTNKYKTIVEETGANYIPYDINFDAEYDLADITQNFLVLLETLFDLNQRGYLIYNKLNYEDVELILYDSMVGFAKNIAREKDIKSVCLCTTLAYNPFVFVFSNMFFSTIKLFAKRFKRLMSILKNEKEFRKKQQIQKLDLIDIFFNKGNETIVFTPKEFQPFSNTFPKSVHFVGPEMHERFSINNQTYENQYDLYISLGSINTEKVYFLSEIDTNDFYKDKTIIINVGNSNANVKSNNIELARYTNQMELLKNCRYFINPGGINSVFEAIFNNVYEICIPMQEEQKLTAKLVQRYKLGFYLKEYDTKKIEKMLFKLTNNKKYKKGMKKFNDIIKKSGGASEAAKIITDLVEE